MIKRWVVVGLLLGLAVGVVKPKAVSQPAARQSRVIAGGIVPHHLLAESLLVDFFSRLTGQQPETVVLLGPNHYERGDYPVLVSRRGWQTPAGTVAADERLIEALLTRGLAKNDDEVVAGDQALTGVMPFVKEYLPRAKVVPLLLSGLIRRAEWERLAQFLADNFTNQTLILASVDFSHYLTGQKAQEKDAVTLGLMREFNYDGLGALNNDYLDSPAAVSVLLWTMEKLGRVRMEVLAHANSGEITRNPARPTTSYFTIVYFAEHR